MPALLLKIAALLFESTTSTAGTERRRRRSSMTPAAVVLAACMLIVASYYGAKTGIKDLEIRLTNVESSIERIEGFLMAAGANRQSAAALRIATPTPAAQRDLDFWIAGVKAAQPERQKR